MHSSTTPEALAHRARHGGYMGLIALLLSALLIGWWAVTYSPLAAPGSATSTTTITKTTGQAAVDDAKKLKDALESRNANLRPD